jgi:hypothetical protein
MDAARGNASTARYTALAPDRFKGFWKDWLCAGSSGRPRKGCTSSCLSASRPVDLIFAAGGIHRFKRMGGLP